MLDFYTLDLTNLTILLLVALAIFTVLNYTSIDKDEDFTFNVSVSLCIAILVSLMYSYLTIEPDEILTANYWD